MSDIELTECLHKQEKDFLISITIHKARNLSVLNADTFVIVSFNGEIKKTKTFQSSDCPYFNEYFVFEVKLSLEELLKKNIRLSVHQSHLLKKSDIIGEFNINLSTIWKQKYHMFIKKWGTLEKFDDDSKENAGYLEVDLAIITSNEPIAPIALRTYDDDLIEENLMLPSECETSEQANVRYLVNIFFGNFVLKKDYILQVTFGSTRIKTRSIKSSKHCSWKEQLIFYGKFPSLNEVMLFELLTIEHLQWEVKSSLELNFNEMCWNVNGKYNYPAFGPSYIVFYEGINNNVFYGKILISISTEVLDQTVLLTPQRKQDIIMPLNENDYWDEEVFKINLILINGDAINTLHNNVRMSMSCENYFTNHVDLELKTYEKMENLKLKYVHYSSNQRPYLTLSVKLPDSRLKNQANNLLKMLTREMLTNIRNFKQFKARYYSDKELQRKCLNNLLNDLKDMLIGLRTKLFYKTFKKLTEWDENFMKYIQSILEISINRIDEIKREENIKNAFHGYIDVRNILESSIHEAQNSPGEVYLHFIKDKKILAYHCFNMLDHFYSQAFDSRGQFCGKAQSVIIKHSMCNHTCAYCGCMFGVFDVIMWIGSDKEVSEWLPQTVLEITGNRVNFTLDKYYRCNVYVHQAKIQFADKISQYSPQLLVIANGKCESTRVINSTLSAIWNEVLVIENVKIFDVGGEKFFENYPTISLFLYDCDKKKLELIGISTLNVYIKPNENGVKLSENVVQKLLQRNNMDVRKIFNDFTNQFPPFLKWRKFTKNANLTAEALLSAELIPLPAPTITIKEREKNDAIPIEINPEIRKFHIEVTFAGIRNAKSLSNFAAGRFRVELTIGEVLMSSNFSNSSYKKNVNFLDPHGSSYILLPENFQFWPPIIIKHLDCSSKKPQIIGTAMIRRPEKFFINQKPKIIQNYLLNEGNVEKSEIIVIERDEEENDEKTPLLSVTNVNQIKVKRVLSRLPKFLQFHSSTMHIDSIQIDSEYTWWTKFYNSNRAQDFKNDTLHDLKIYHSELEKQSEFQMFRDWAYPIELRSGKKREKYATLKTSIKISKCTGKEFFETEKFEGVPTSFRFKLIQNLQCELPVLIRVYIVEAINLRTHDLFGYSDAYIKIKFGKQVISDRAHYMPNQFNPIFGKRYQISGVIPKDTVLKISVYDRDTFLKDDLIGKTQIDIEDRLRTKYEACCGLPREYNSRGYNTWRNSQLPSEILTRVCSDHDLTLPQYFPHHIELAGIQFKDTSKVTNDENLKERMALSVLNNFHKIPGIGFNFVPEHVETRPLYRKDRLGVEQGKLMMWIELFDPRKTVPEPVDITPVPPRAYELRVIIWNAKDVVLSESNIFGARMSDIYVKGWLENIDDAQYTDVHYRSLNGEGNFNWRLIFPFKYSIAEDMLILNKNNKISKIPPVLTLQIWDNDSFTPDDFLGSMSLNLSHFPCPSQTPEKCQISSKENKFENLFAIVDGSLRGWFPLRGNSEGNKAIKQTGKLEIEIQVLTEERARLDPAGKGRDEPQKLSPPQRPNTSFHWFKDPVQSMKIILWPQIKKCLKYLGIVLVVLFVILIIVLSIINLPQNMLAKFIGL